MSQHNSVTTQQCHNSKSVIFQEKLLKVLKCYNFLLAQRRHNCSPAASFANCIMTLYLLKVHLQTFLFIPITQKCQISSCDSILLRVRSFKVGETMIYKYVVSALWESKSLLANGALFSSLQISGALPIMLRTTWSDKVRIYDQQAMNQTVTATNILTLPIVYYCSVFSCH